MSSQGPSNNATNGEPIQMHWFGEDRGSSQNQNQNQNQTQQNQNQNSNQNRNQSRNQNQNRSQNQNRNSNRSSNRNLNSRDRIIIEEITQPSTLWYNHHPPAPAPPPPHRRSHAPRQAARLTSNYPGSFSTAFAADAARPSAKTGGSSHQNGNRETKSDCKSKNRSRACSCSSRHSNSCCSTSSRSTSGFSLLRGAFTRKPCIPAQSQRGRLRVSMSLLSGPRLKRVWFVDEAIATHHHQHDCRRETESEKKSKEAKQQQQKKETKETCGYSHGQQSVFNAQQQFFFR